MTESEWLACGDVKELSLFLYFRAGQRGEEAFRRKLRLFAAACGRRIWHLLADARCRAAIEMLERSAEEAVPRDEFLAAHHDALRAWKEMAEEARAAGYATPLAQAMSAAGLAAYQMIDGDVQFCGNAADAVAAFAADEEGGKQAARTAEQSAQVRLLRDLLGNPFRPVPLPPAWLQGACGELVQRLASAAYAERALPTGELDPNRLAVLADALEDAGCDGGEMLAHCRDSGPHQRGCWVLDRLLEREREQGGPEG